MPKSSSQRVTSHKVAMRASQALRDGRSSARTRSIAGSAMAQAKAHKRGSSPLGRRGAPREPRRAQRHVGPGWRVLGLVGGEQLGVLWTLYGCGLAISLLGGQGAGEF